MNNIKNPGRQGGPAGRQPREPKGEQLNFNGIVPYQQSFNKEAFDQLVKSQGVLVTHYRAIPDPTGMNSKGDVHAVRSPRHSSDGFLYKEVGKLQIFFSNNSSNFSVQAEGLIKNDTAIATMPDTYEDCPDPVLLAPYDRFFLADIEIRVVNMQYIQANTTGIDKLQYPATCVEYLIDADGIEYKEGQHFEITPEGFIKWTSQQRPGFDPKTSRGTVYSIRYRYRPYYVVGRILHEIRVSQVTDPATFERKVERMPYQVFLVREHILSDINHDPASSLIDQRFQNAPPVGGITGPSDGLPDGGNL